MKTSLLTFLLLTFLYTSSFAQQVVIELTTSSSGTSFKVGKDGTGTIDDHFGHLVYNFNLGLSTKLKQQFYLKTQIGTNDVRSFVSYRFSSPNGADEIDFSGHLNLQQYYLEVLPEIRTKILFVNAGLGLSKARKSEIGFASYYRNRRSLENPMINWKYNMQFSLHVGINPTYKKLGFLLIFGYRNLIPTKIHPDLPRIGVEQINIQTGVSYSLN